MHPFYPAAFLILSAVEYPLATAQYGCSSLCMFDSSSDSGRWCSDSLTGWSLQGCLNMLAWNSTQYQDEFPESPCGQSVNETVDWLNKGCGRDCFVKPSAVPPPGGSFGYDPNDCWASSVDADMQEEPFGLIPWSWTVSPTTQGGSQQLAADCPSVAATLGMFAVVNVVAATAAVIFGHNRVSDFITRTICCKTSNPQGWKKSWIIGLIISIGANLGVVYLIKYTPGYELGYTVWELFLFFATRPRFSWVANMALAGIHGSYTEDGERRWHFWEKRRKAGTRMSYSIWGEEDYYWASSAKAALIAEMIVQFLGAYPIGKSVYFAASYHLYSNSFAMDGQHSSLTNAARTMYVGALMWIISRPFSLYLLFLPFKMQSQMPVFLSISLFIWLSQWLFMGGFVWLASLQGLRYCPPKTLGQGGIWSAAAILSSLFYGSI